MYNPAVALHDMLPPSPLSFSASDTRSEPMMLGNQDSNGFNAGVFFCRVDQSMLAFIQETLDNEPRFYEIYHRHPSDQALFGFTMLNTKSNWTNSTFYEIPMMWVNAYDTHHQQGNQPELEWTPQLQVHLVDRLWERTDWQTNVLAFADRVYEEGAKLAKQAEVDGPGLHLMGDGQKTRYAAMRWWEVANPGVEDVQFDLVV